MRFDMSRAWSDATDMLKANREVLLILSGVFFFLPGFASSLLIGDSQPPAGADEAAIQAYLLALYKDNAPIILISGLIQLVGSLTLLALLRDDSKPTVGEALKTGAIGLLPYIGVYLILVVGLTLAAMLVIVAPMSAGAPAIAIVFGIAAVPLLIYLLIKLSLIMPAIAIEKLVNPVAIIQRSWRLTKGNSVRLLLYYFLLTLVYLVIALVVSGITTMLLSLVGAGTAFDVGTGIIGGLLGAAGTMVFTVVIAAVHRQLAGPSTGTLNQTFA